MLLPFLLAAAPVHQRTLADTERALAMQAAAGEWQALRAHAAPGAVLLHPRPVSAASFLDSIRSHDPARFQVETRAIACDADQAVSTGHWQRGGDAGTFAIVWNKQPDGEWRWFVASFAGERDASPFTAAPAIERRASCAGNPVPAAEPRPQGGTFGQGKAIDGTLHWRWHATSAGALAFDATLWTRAGWLIAARQRAPAPPSVEGSVPPAPPLPTRNR